MQLWYYLSLFIYLPTYLFIYLSGKNKQEKGTAFSRAGQCSEKPPDHLRLPIPAPYPSDFAEGLPTACIILPDLRCCAVFPQKGPSSYLEAFSWVGHVPWRTPPTPASSGSFQILSQSQLTCLLLEPRAKARLPAFDTEEGAPCSVRPRALLTADQDVFLE